MGAGLRLRGQRQPVGLLHPQNRYLNNRIEQDHRAIKQRYYPMLGFGCMESAKRFYSAFEELRQYLRIRPRSGEQVSLSERRRVFLARWQALTAEMAAA
jgi:transposase-like protein